MVEIAIPKTTQFHGRAGGLIAKRTQTYLGS